MAAVSHATAEVTADYDSCRPRGCGSSWAFVFLASLPRLAHVTALHSTVWNNPGVVDWATFSNPPQTPT